MTTVRFGFLTRRVCVLAVFIALPFAAFWVRTASPQGHLLLAAIIVIFASAGYSRSWLFKTDPGRNLAGATAAAEVIQPPESASNLEHSIADQVRAGSATVRGRFRDPGFKAHAQPAAKTWSAVRDDGSQCRLSIPDVREETSRPAESFSALEDLANRDQLTGLANRFLLGHDIRQAINRSSRSDEKLALYMVGIDNFTRINQSLGHENGDILLKWVASQLESAVRKSDTVARVGGDEFAVLMPDFRDFADTERCAQLLLQVIAQPHVIADCEVRVTASIGYCAYPDAAASASELLLGADIAMREAKATGRNTCRSFSPDMHKEASHRMELEGELRQALEKSELSLHYQPQIHCRTKEVVGMEMLLRWNNKKRGFIPPNVFIPIAEKAGLLNAVGEWSLRQACKDSVSLQAELGRSLVLAVNLSPSQMSQPNLISIVRDALQDSGLPAHQLEIEITEQVLMATKAPVLQTLRALRDLGVKIAIDDFGTGYSSFSYILQYRFDRLKVDRSFISQSTSDSTAASIVRTIIAMAHGMNLEVVAEGVETTDQMNFLLRRKCDQVQGFLFSKAVPFAEFADAVSRIEGDSCRASLLSHAELAATNYEPVSDPASGDHTSGTMRTISEERFQRNDN